jgi:hypothetical protein
MSRNMGLEAYNRDRGGAQHEKGDVEIDGLYYGCKRRKVVPRWVMPEKEENGVIFRADRMEPYISIPFEKYLVLISAIKI